MKVTQLKESPMSSFLFADTRTSVIWLVLRVYIGWEWLQAGLAKVNNPAWTGDSAGSAVSGFVTRAIAKTAGEHPDVQGWYAQFLQGFVLNNSVFFSYLVAYGEVLVGIALIVGLFTGISAFFGAFMNMNYLFAGTVSINPIMSLIQLFLILAWRVAGWIGVDRWLLPKLGTPWDPGTLFKK